MKTTKTTFITLALAGFATLAVARGSGDRSADASRTSFAGSRDSATPDLSRAARPANQDMSAGRAPAGLSRGISAPASAAPAPSYTPRQAPAPSYTPRQAPAPSSTPRQAPAPATTYRPSARPDAGAFSGGPAREAPVTPQARTYTAPRAVTESSSAPVRTRSEAAPRTTVVRETPARTIPTPETRSSGLGNAAPRRDDSARPAVPATTPRVLFDDNARNSGTARGTYQAHPEAVTPVTPAVTRRSADPQRTPVTTPVERATPRVTERPQTAVRSPANTFQPRSPDPSKTTVSPASSLPPGLRTVRDKTPLTPSSTRDSGPAASLRPQARDVSTAARSPTSLSPFPRIPTPDTRIAAPTSTRGTSGLRFGSAGDPARSRSAGQTPAVTSLRSMPRGEDGGRIGLPAGSGPSPSGFKGRNAPSSAGDRPSTSRYTDGRSSVYRSPDRYASMSSHDDTRRQPGGHGQDGGHNPPSGHNRPPEHRPWPSSYHHNDHHNDHHDGHHYSHYAFSPVWCGPVAYPAGSYFGFGWSDGSFGLSFAAYSPAYSYSTRYYDSWSCGGWGYSGVYYGGWRNNWYGGFSYVYNPWPVYRSYYLYEPEPLVVTRTETVYVTQPAETVYVTQPAETVYVTQPAETVYVTQPAATTYVVQNAAAAPAVEQPAYVAAAPLQTQAVWDAAPAVEHVETVASSCFCPCHCNGQRPCTCDYPCGSEYAVVADQFDLSFTYSPYAESLNPEKIWSSYAGLDRWDAYAEPSLYDTTVSAGSDRR